MNADFWLPVLTVATSLGTGLAIFLLREEQVRLRSALNLAGAFIKLALVVVMLLSVGEGVRYEARWVLSPGLELVLRVDTLSLLFVTLSVLLWTLTTVYAIGYMEHAPHRSRFFGFFSLCVFATTGLALAGNLFTLFVFYEILTLVTYPLVVHRGTPQAIAAGRTYLRYTLPAGSVLLVAVVAVQLLAGPQDFVVGGYLGDLVDVGGGPPAAVLVLLFVALVGGLAVKAAMFPLHGWLPVAMVAPAPVSALLHAVAVVKAGAFAIVRVVYDVFGVDLAEQLGVLPPLAALAAFTILYGSWRALAQNELKKRLAYSTISQVSYIVLGIAVFGPLSTIGALVHLVHQGLMKITLFFAAGNIAETLGVHKVNELDGIGRRLPYTMAAFTVGALGMIGVPPVAGFVSKFYLGAGAADAGQWWVIAVLAGSSLLNAAYFLPILYRAWFKPQRGPWPHEELGRDAKPALLWPTLAAALFAIGVGVFAATPMSPLEWTRLIAEREFGYAAGLRSVTSAPLSVLAWSYVVPALAPLLVLVLILLSRPVGGVPGRSRLRWLLPMAALPALVVALAAPSGSIDLPMLLLGARFELNDTTRWFLLFSAALWAAAAIYAVSYLRDDPRRALFDGFYLAAMTGNFGLVLAADAASFYVFFALMSFASYGLVVHTRQGAALLAGRVYIALVVVGELALFAAVVLAAQAAGSLYLADISAAVAQAPMRDAVIALLLIAFGIKAGLIGLHMWLPLAHPAAPTPASAVLSGAMIKAGLLGLLQFLPLGHPVPVWGEILVMAGVAGALLGAIAGALQNDAKAALAYSSISQMGLIIVAVGVALAVPQAAPAAVLAATLYAFHHAFAKAALFLGVGMAGAPRWLLLIGLLLPALALTGLPFTSGAGAKLLLKEGVTGFGAPALGWLLALAAAGTTLVMARVVVLVARTPLSAHAHSPHGGMWVGWGLLVVGSAVAFWLLPVGPDLAVGTWADIGSALWPIALGAAFALALSRWSRLEARPLVPPGDVIVPLLGEARKSRAASVPLPVTSVLESQPRRQASPAQTTQTGLQSYETMALRGSLAIIAALGMLILLLFIAAG